MEFNVQLRDANSIIFITCAARFEGLRKTDPARRSRTVEQLRYHGEMVDVLYAFARNMSYGELN